MYPNRNEYCDDIHIIISKILLKFSYNCRYFCFSRGDIVILSVILINNLKMKHRIIQLFLCVIIALSVCAEEVSSRQSVGLVLSGGGAKGIAHIGVIKALEENDIPIDYIAGTSMGAIVGGLYSAGYTPDEMLELIQSPDFAHWSTGQIDEKLTYYFAKDDPTPVLMKFNIGDKDSTRVNSILPQGLINPLPMNFAFMELFSAYTAQCGGDFDNLYVPFRCVASDVTHKRKVVCRDGDLGDAIRASMTFPVVFYPIEINGVLMFDGGIYDNFPVDVMKEDFAPSIIIGVDVSSPESGPKANDVMDQLEDMIMQGNTVALSDEDGIYMRLNLERFGLLDFPKAKEIYQVGYNRAVEMMDTISTRIKSRVSLKSRELQRNVFKAKTPYVLFDKVVANGGSKSQNDYIEYLFTKGKTDTFGLERAKDAYYRAISPGKLSNLIPHALYDDKDGLFALDLNARVKDSYRIGFGGYISSSTNSMLFMSGGYNTLSFNSFDASLNAWIGQSYMAGEMNAKMYMRSAVPSYLKLQVVASRHKFYESENLFYEENMPTFITNSEVYARLSYCLAAGRSGKFDIGVGYGYLYDRFYQSDVLDFATSERDKCSYNLGQLRAEYEYNTLNAIAYPTSGAFYNVTAIGALGKYDYNPANVDAKIDDNQSWGQISLQAENYFPMGNVFSLGTSLNALASTKKLIDNYYASIVQAPAYNPTESSYNAFNPAFRANSFVAASIKPIIKIGSNLQLRCEAHCFVPMRKIVENNENFKPYYGRWFSDPEFMGEVSLVLNLPFASLRAYSNYMSYPSDNWNFGFSLGHFFIADKFLK